MRNRSWRIGSVVVVTIVLTALVTAAIAATQTKTGRTVTQVKVVTSTDARATTSSSWTNLTGAATSVTVPSGTRELLLIRFSAEATCRRGSEGFAVGCGGVRILANGTETSPAAGMDFGFVDETEGYGQANAMERVFGPVMPGSYSIQVQFVWLTAGTCSFFPETCNFQLDDWTLTVERIRV